MSNGFDVDVVVVGGGISGLACALGIEQQGGRVVVLEAEAQPGGCIATSHDHGYLLESGPNSALDTTPRIASLLDTLGISSERIAANPQAGNRYVVRNGQLHALPMSPLSFLATPLFSMRAKLRLLGEPFIAPAAPDEEESVADFVRRRLGDEFLDYAINPFVGGVYAGDPRALSVASAFPRLRELEQTHGSLIRGQLFGARARQRNPEKSKESAPMFSFRDGMQTLTDALVRRLARVETGAQVTRIRPGNDGFAVEFSGLSGGSSFRAQSVVLAVPAWVAAKLVEPVAAGGAEALAAIPYPPVTVVHSAYHRSAMAHPLDGFGMLVPEREGRRILGTLFSSTLFPGRAQAGSILLTTFIGGARQPGPAQLDAAEIAAIAQAEHLSLLGASAKSDFVRVTRWPHAIPQYNLGHAARIRQIEHAEHAFPGLFFCANYRGGVAIGDCVRSAHKTAGNVAALLRGRR